MGESCVFSLNNMHSLFLPLGEAFQSALSFSVSVMLNIIKIDEFENIFHYLLNTAWLLLQLFPCLQNKV